MIAGIHAEVLFAAGYAVLLLLTAAGLEMLARQAHRRALRYHTAGFTYRREYDAWGCPAGEHLYRIETDHTRRVIVYRAPAHKCNGCGIKHRCTDSNEGREISHPLDEWLVPEIGRFHRGISLTLLLLAALILGAEIFRHNRPHDLVVLGGTLAPVGIIGTKLWAGFAGRQEETAQARSPR